jgi:hypothetical protein
MNPPFLQGAQHVLKAWDLLYEGEIVAILNAETVRNPCSKEREHLVRLIAQHGEVEFIEGAFSGSDAERKTDVDVALVYLKKESNFSKELFGNILDDLKREGHIGLDAGFEEANELAIPGSFIENSVLAFNAAIKAMRESVFAEARASKYAARLGKTIAEMNTEQASPNKGDKSSLQWVRSTIHERHTDYKDRAWSGILRSTQVLSRLSSSAQKRIEAEFQTIQKLEFSVSNIYGFLGGLIAKQGEIQIGMACDVFDLITRYHSDNNTVYYMGWKSNDNHRTCGMSIKKTRFIIPGNQTNGYDRNISWDGQRMLADFDKVFAMLDCKQFPEISLVNVFESQFDELCSGHRVASSYFDVRYYSGVGTIHFFARDKKLVDRLNKLVGAQRKWLPPEGTRVNDAFWLQFEQAEKFDKTVRAEVAKAKRSYWDDPFHRLNRDDDYESTDRVLQAIATILERNGIDPNAMLEAPKPDTQTAQLPLLAAA